ncbi:glycosyltransferase family 2 protein [Pseudidiomarina salilacus]|uniref:glycosyltransferase family 2 protein n=1 Tax=Pseudidiomarina salilacus TaxID=3384452 RepID=UPI00398526FC
MNRSHSIDVALPLVSIIMPVFNVEDFVAESIRTVLHQTYSNWELIIIDDHSTDASLGVVTSFSADDRIKIFTNEKNLGGAGARNRGINAASGKYIAFLDSDDLWLPTKLERQIAFMEKHKISFSYTGYQSMTESGDFISAIEVPEFVDFKRLCSHNYIPCLTAIYNAEKLGKVLMPAIRKRQDYALWLRIIGQCKVGFGVTEQLAYYRIRQGSLSRNKLDNIKYYYAVLASQVRLNRFQQIWFSLVYTVIAALKLKAPTVYNKVWIRTLNLFKPRVGDL